MAGDRGIGSVRQTELLQSRLAAPRRHVGGAGGREEAIEQHLVQIGAVERGPNRAANQPAALAEDRDRMLVAVRLREQRLLGDPALMPQRLELPGVDAVTVAFQALLGAAGQRQIHVVAAKQDVIADRDPIERQVAVAVR